MLTFTASEERQNNGFMFIGSSKTSSVSLITGEAVGSVSLLAPSKSSNCGFDTCSFYSEPSESTILSFGESYESCGIIANNYSEAGGYTGGGESCGIIASSGSFSSSASFSGVCSYSC